jgi:hypothetical protein
MLTVYTLTPALKLQTLKSSHTVHFYVLYDSHTEKRLFPPKSINRLIFVMEMVNIYCEVKSQF